MPIFTETQQNPYRWYVVLAVIGFSLSFNGSSILEE
jgi:hypothetical protein